MKKTFLLSLALFALLVHVPDAHASPEDMPRRRAQIEEMAKDKEIRAMMIRQLMSTSEGKKEMAEMLRHDAEFRFFYESNSVNPG